MLTALFVVLGAVLIALTLADKAVRRLPLTPAVIYLAVGLAAGALIDAPGVRAIEKASPSLTLATELAVLISLFAVGLRLRVPFTLKAWGVALWMAGPGMLVAIALGAVAAHWLFEMPWPAALLLSAIMAPTDPVLASEVQIRSADDRDAVRLSVSAEGGLNDGSAFPAVMLGLGLMGLHTLGNHGMHWWWADLALPIGGGAVLGTTLGLLLGQTLKRRIERGEEVARDELLYAGAVTLAYGLAQAMHTSAFVTVFALGATLLWPLHAAETADTVHSGKELGERMHAFGTRCERLVEATSVLAVGIALHSVEPSWAAFAFGLVLVFVVRPLSVLAVIRRGSMTRAQRRLMAWFGIRGIGSLFYLAFALQQGVNGALAEQFMAAVLIGVALSIVLHGVSATPLMSSYHARRKRIGVTPEPPR